MVKKQTKNKKQKQKQTHQKKKEKQKPKPKNKYKPAFSTNGADPPGGLTNFLKCKFCPQVV